MKKTSGRRDFIKNVGVGSTMAFIPLNILSVTDNKKPTPSQEAELFTDKPSEKRQYGTPYTGEFLNRVAFPIGGLGAGMFCLEGTGVVSQVSIRNQPDMFND